MLQNAPEFNSVGGGFGGFGGGYGGIGGIGLFGLLGLRGIGGLDGDGHRRGGGEDNCCEDIKNNARNLAVLEALSNGKDATISEGRALAGAICDLGKTNLQQFYAAAIQTANETQAIKDQAIALAIANNQNITELKEAGVNQTAAILARLNQNEIDELRDRLFSERRRGDSREVEISINNTANAQQAQVQAQFQSQNDFLVRKFHDFDNQINSTKQGIINLGTMTASGTQSTAATNIK